MFGPPAGDGSSSSGGTDGSKQWKEIDSTKYFFLLSVPNEWFHGKEIGYDGVRPWLARGVCLDEADFVDFLLARGVLAERGYCKGWNVSGSESVV